MTKPGLFTGALDRRLTWVVAGLLPLIFFGIVMLIMFTRQQEQAIERLLREAAAGAAHVVDRAVGEQLGIMNGMAASLAFDRGDLDTIRAESLRLWEMHPEWRTVIVTDEHRPLMNLRSPPGGPITPLRDPESLARVWSTGKPSVGNLVSDYVGLRVPVAPGGRMAYTIAVPVDPRFFRDILAKHKLEQPWSAAVIGSDRAVIAATPESPLMEGQPLPEKFEPAPGGFRAAEADYQAWAPVGTSGWNALIIAPAAAVERPFARARTAVLVGGACSAVLTAFLVVFLSSAWAVRREATHLRSEISERDRVENALRESEERFRRFAENAYEGIWALDTDQRVTFANRRLAAMLGTTIDELIGRPAVDFIFPGELADHGAEMEVRRKGERSSYERRMLHKDGTPVWTLVSAVPILDAENRFTGSFGMFTDITARKAADQAIRESEERFRLTFDASPDSVNINRLEDGLYVEVNQGFTALTGWRREEVLGRTSIEINIWHDPGDRRRLVERLNATGVCDNLQAQFRRKDGSLTTALMSARVLSLNGVRHIVSITRDISKRIAAEAALKESEERYRQVVDLVPDAISIFVDERFVFTNRSGLAMVGADDVDALHGRLVWDFTHPRYVRLGQERYRKCLRDGTPLPPAEFELIGPGGRPTHIESSAVPIQYQGSPALLAVWRDVTSRKAAESALRENEELFRGTFDLSPVGQTMSDLDYRYLRCNEAFCRFLGYPERELVGRSVLDVTHPEDRHTRSVVPGPGRRQNGASPISEALLPKRRKRGLGGCNRAARAQPGGGPPSHALGGPGHHGEGPERPGEGEARSPAAAGAEDGGVGTLAGGIAHDFNNILGVIIGGAEMLELTDAARDSSRDTLANIMGASQRARDLVKQILAFSRHTRQEKILLNLKSIVKETVEFMRASLPATIQLQHYIESASGAIVADPTQMQQVLMNLCTNAAHAMEREGGILQIKMADVELGASDVGFDGDLKPGRYVRLTVGDTGHGIDPAMIQRIFEPYFTTKEKGKGTGLGLAVVHGIVAAHNGAITVSSEPGKGTTFEVFLPCAEGYAEEAGTRHAEPLPTGSGRILLVDDEAALLDTDRQILSLLGYTVEATTNPLDALAAFQAAPHAFDLVLTDMTMPQMTGLKIAGRMMELRPDIPVIICTGFSDQINPQQAHAAGIKALLMKPLMARELAEAIRSALGQ